MKKLRYRDRIALHYLLITAGLLLLLFLLLYIVVYVRVYNYMDSQLDAVAERHLQEVRQNDDGIHFHNKTEWEEHEHRVAEVNPVFITLFGINGRATDKSPNLKEEQLKIKSGVETLLYYNTQFNGKDIRQIQVPVVLKGKVSGYLVAAMPAEGYLMVLKTLQHILSISFPVTLIILFFLARYLAGRSIQPIRKVIRQMNTIRQDTLNIRVAEPATRDELYWLSTSINDLLSRIEQGFLREKQFTSDAAHQLKTPLAVMKGSFGVLLRKPRNTDEYQQTINEAMEEIDRMSSTVDQLLLLARLDGNHHRLTKAEVSLVELTDNIIHRFSKQIQARQIRVKFEPEINITCITDPFLAELIVENLISNAVKYSNQGGIVVIGLQAAPEGVTLTIEDQGIGIEKDDLERIFDPFYRSHPTGHPSVKGDGLGLSIAQRACRLLNCRLDVVSEPQRGTRVTLCFCINTLN